MRPILMDTNAYVAFKKGVSSILEVIQYAEVLAISPVVLGELLGGFECGNKTTKNLNDLQQFLQASRVRIFSITSDTAKFYAQVYSALKNKGHPIPTNDIWIAAQALENGCVLCSYDKHFKAIEGLITGVALSELSI
ncbi:MAG TPA: type II toxin-antitoxin system VapC family toxin [Rhabdochlamydiaceae bacterium]|jgi:predicted nucleic acid-binding protein|nr:type II toxin-antitoxin system VapC family toxin [Rhabdochlamydiaceae bacterium]